MADSSWKPVNVPSVNTMQAIMSEQTALSRQEKAITKLLDELGQTTRPLESGATATKNRPNADDIPDDLLKALQAADPQAFDNDALIAQTLQAQFDLEHDLELGSVERARNKDAKVKVSYKNYQLVPETWMDEFRRPTEADSVVNNKRADSAWDRFDEVEKELGQMSRRGYKFTENGSIVTKHDERLNGVRNVRKIMSFAPEVRTGDGAGFDMKVNNKVYNQLRAHSKRTDKSRQKKQDRKENVATAEMGIDEPTRLVLYKLVNNQVLERVNGIVSAGKEAVILHADCDENYEGELKLPKECAIKIFKTTLNDFKQRDRYIKDDYRFRDRFSKQNNRTIIGMWAEKEMHNLKRMQKAGIACPDVLYLRKHILMMSFIGTDGLPAPKLKDASHLTDAQWTAAYIEVVDMMTRLYQEANLVHADLSEYNILYFENRCHFIDVAQSIEPGHPSAFEYLLRDCGNVVDFFGRKGVPHVISKETLFMNITGLDSVVHHTTMLERLHNKGVPEHVATSTDIDELPEAFKPVAFPFDYAFEEREYEETVTEDKTAENNQ